MERLFTRKSLIREVHRAGQAFREGASARPLALALAALEAVDPELASELGDCYRASPWPCSELLVRASPRSGG